ncbi:MAG: DUF1598 domain-containing protein, partial [Planctomycetales bacterium]|nr:DUF1598 domain-containing protein [Planctomycetales bacterium]
MSRRFRFSVRMLLSVTAAVAVVGSLAYAGHLNVGGNRVGGVSIDAEGVVREPSEDARGLLLEHYRKSIQNPSPDLAMPTDLRMISLKGLEAAIADARQNNLGQLPDEVRFLAGLQRIEYVFVYPDRNDIVLAGPGEGWKIRDDATVVGITTDRPVMLLDDLIVALRQVEAARQVGISVSIDPTQEGMQRLNEYLAEQRRRKSPVVPALWEPAMKEAFGPQQVRFTGVPTNSHFARVLLAADYRMKRLGMKLDPSPVKGLPSYIDLLNRTRLANNATPRWWLACNYDSVLKSEDGLAWQIRGQGVKAETEESFLTKDGQVAGTGKTSGPAKDWADAMTTHYDELSRVDGVFGELRNLMDMCVVAALIEKHGLLAKAGCSLPLLMNEDSELAYEKWHAPKLVAPHCSFVRSRNGWTITASGGVQIESWQVAENTQTSAELPSA